MQNLEKILEEIDREIEERRKDPEMRDVDICYGLNRAKLEKNSKGEKMSEIKLKPCPFCGGEAEMIEDANHMSFVRCEQRCCRTYFFESPKVASIAWNRRAGEQDEVKRK